MSAKPVRWVTLGGLVEPSQILESADLLECQSMASESDAMFLVCVTPELATKWLEKNDDNRPLRESVVREHAADMRADAWPLTNQTIGFSKDGKLIDGQHRLWAIVESDTSVVLRVVVGVVGDIHLPIDVGAKRSLGFISGNTTHYIAVVSAMARHFGGVSKLRFANFAEVEKRFETELHWAKEHAGKGGSGSCRPLSVVTAVLAYAYPLDREKVEHFWEQLIGDGANLPEGSPVLALRNRLIAARSNRGRLPEEEMCASTLSAICAVLEGRELKRAYGRSTKKTGGALYARTLLERQRRAKRLYVHPGQP